MTKIHEKITEELFGTEHSFQGKAVDSKAGACIQLKDGNVIFIQNISSWEDDYYHKEVIVVGKLFDKKIIPDVYVAEDGGISQGAPGTQLIIEDVQKITLV